jgi:hypothetical protein
MSLKIPEKIKVNGKERSTKNSLGKLIASDIESIENFWKWFADSTVVDEQGRPLVCYHGTCSDFDEFIPNTGYDGVGLIFVSTSFEQAKAHTSCRGGNIMPVYVKIEKLKPRIHLWADEIKIAKSILKNKNFDGFSLRDDYESSVGYAVFSPNQIKSVIANNGNFSVKSNKITESILKMINNNFIN